MKTLKQKRIQKIAFIAMGILSIIFVIVALVDPHTAFASLAVAPIIIGGITYEGKEAEMLTAVSELVRKEFDKNDKGYISEKTLTENIQSHFAKFKVDLTNDETVKKLQKALEDQNVILQSQGLMLKSFQESGSQRIESFTDQYKKHLESDQFKSFLEGKTSKLSLNFKVATTITTANATNMTPWQQLIPGLTPIIADKPDFLNTLFVGRTTSPYIIWIEKEHPDGTAIAVLEGGLKAIQDFDLVVNHSTPVKYPGYSTLSKESLTDIPFMETEINTELRRKCTLAANTGLGVYLTGTAASAYTILTVSTLTPNLADCIRAAMAQINSLYLNADRAYINPIDAANLDLEKTAYGYVIPPFASASGTIIKGIQVFESNNVAQGSVLVLDSSKVRIWMYEDFNIQVGWINDNLIYNLVTIVGEMRLHYYVEDAYKAAFVYDTIANIKTAIQKL